MTNAKAGSSSSGGGGRSGAAGRVREERRKARRSRFSGLRCISQRFATWATAETCPCTDSAIISADTSRARPQSIENRTRASAPIPRSKIRPFRQSAKIKSATRPKIRLKVSHRRKRPSKSDAKIARAINNSLIPASMAYVGLVCCLNKSPIGTIRVHRGT